MKTISVKQIPTIAGIDKKGRLIYEDDWQGEINAESDSGFLYRISLRSHGDLDEILKAINTGLSHIIEMEKS